jgi:hypothetical protein
VKPPRRDTRALSPAGMFKGKAPLRLAAQKSRLHAPLAPMRIAPAYFLCKWGILTRLYYTRLGAAAGNLEGTANKYLRRATSGAAGFVLGNTMNLLWCTTSAAAGSGRAQRPSTCDAHQAALRVASWHHGQVSARRRAHRHGHHDQVPARRRGHRPGRHD